jgi:ATP-dependent DNA helicase
MVLLVYSGHGGVEADLTGEEPDGNSKYLIPHDARLGSLFSTAILNSTMTTMLERINSNQIIFLLDCCYSGGFGDTQGSIRSIASRATRVQTDVYRDFAGSGRVVISASLPNQLSMELPELNHGIFTYNLLRGISGEADTNQDGSIALVCELYPFLHLAVGNMARDYGFMQEPMLKCQIAGDLILSKVHKAGLRNNEEGIKE